ncbi:hypothetical protein GbCGDNIH4_7194 [Granulibacter bethesdensis CGDNIH4]|nr:hypothetical protein GbCGDNIH4_7194 [Granulibacter bethesdensis CGDNIH4]
MNSGVTTYPSALRMLGLGGLAWVRTMDMADGGSPTCSANFLHPPARSHAVKSIFLI